MEWKQKCTKEDFLAYEEVRRSGVTNMFAVQTVSRLSGLPLQKISHIMSYYGKYAEMYLEE